MDTAEQQITRLKNETGKLPQNAAQKSKAEKPGRKSHESQKRVPEGKNRLNNKEAVG